MQAAKHQKVHFRFAQMLNKQIGWAMAVDYTGDRFSISSDPMIKVILVIYFNYNPALTPLQKRPLQLVEMPKNTRFSS